jgi:hypothetical protein
MKAPYPKHPRDIKIRIIHRTITEGIVSTIKTTAEVPLNVKLYDYVVRLGYSSSHLVGFIVQLFTKGKVRVDFNNYTERLELVDIKDKLSGAQAMSLFDDFVSEIGDTGMVENLLDQTRTTQRIIVNPPSVSSSSPSSSKKPNA